MAKASIHMPDRLGQRAPIGGRRSGGDAGAALRPVRGRTVERGQRRERLRLCRRADGWDGIATAQHLEHDLGCELG